MAQITISSLPPAPAGTGTGSSQGTDLFPATDVTDTSSASTGTTKKYTLSEIYNFMLHAQGLTTYSAVRVATTLALSASYNNGTLGVGATLTNAGVIGQLTIDGIALSVADRVLVKNQASAFENGIYVVTIAGDVSTNWVLTRATDYDNSSEIIQYGVVLSNQGTSNAGILWQQISPGPFTIGVSSITFDTYTTQSLALPVLPSQGGTGIVNNNASTWTINGAFPFVGTLTGATNVTFPVSGTLATTANTVSSATGTANEVLVNGTSGIAQTGALTFSLPQAIGTLSNVIFATVSGTNSVSAGSPTGNANNLIISLSPTAASGAFIMRAADSTGNFNGFLQNASMTASRTWTLPDATGILALSNSTISSIQGTINQVLVNGTSGSPVTGAAVTLTTPQDIATTSNPVFATVTGTNSVAAGSPSGNVNNLLISLSPTAGSGAMIVRAADSAGNFNGFLQNASISASRTWTLPDASGTVLLTGSAINSVPSITFSSTSGIIGTTTNNNAAAGSVGESMYIQVPSSSPVSISDGVIFNACQLNLTPGNWIVYGNLGVNVSVNLTAFLTWLSLSSATGPDPSLSTSIYGISTTIYGVPAPVLRVSVATTTTVYLSGLCSFSGTGSVYGQILAIRPR